MMEFFAAAAVFGLSGGLSPGPLLALVVAETLARGRSAGLAVAASPLITDGPIIVAAVLLLGRIEGFEAALGQHYLWGLMLATLLVLGVGRLSVDAMLERRGTPSNPGTHLR